MNRYKKANEGIHAPEHVKERAAGLQGRRGGYPRWAGAVAAMLAVVLMGGIALYSGNRPTVDRPTPYSEDGPGPRGLPVAYAATTLAQADYPDNWGRVALAENAGRDEFLADSAARFLAGAGEGNRVYSPLNVYLALSMLAEVTGGDSRQQILDLLGEGTVESLRAQAKDLWLSAYRTGQTESLLANSLWLREGMTYRQETLDILAKDYFASSFSGEMGTEAYDQALRNWINEQTYGLLNEQASGLALEPDTVLALASTLYFKGEWRDAFAELVTGTGTFHGPSGDVEADFMRNTVNDSFYWGDRFTAVALDYKLDGKMWLILPNEGTTADELLQSGEAMDFLLAPKADLFDEQGKLLEEGWTGQKEIEIHLSVPKFDVSSDLDLIEGLKSLGITDVFDSSVSNFDPLGASTDDPLYVSQARHAARVKVDEEGCEAAATTVINMNPGAAPSPREEVFFTLDRPFLFAVTLDSGLPLFTGVVNQPNG